MAIRFLVAGRTGGDPNTTQYWEFVDHLRVVTPLTDTMREIIIEANRRGIKVSGEKPDIQKEIDHLLRSAA